MEEGFVNTALEFIEARPLWLIGAAFGFALLESLALVGLIVPGVVLLFLVGAAVGLDPVLFAWCWPAAALGALTGDLVSYWIGRQFRDDVSRLWPISRRPDLLAGSQMLFARHGGKAVFIGRFIGPIRPVAPLIAGTMRLRARLFLAFAIPAAVLWAPVYLLPGMLFGASLDLAAEFAGRLVLLLLIVVLGIWFVLWVTRLGYDFTARRSGWWLKRLIQWAHRHPVAGRLVGDVLEPGRNQVLPLALLGLILALSLLVLLTLLVLAPFVQPSWDAQRELLGLAASLRNHFADPVFVALALAGEVRVSAILAGLVLIALLTMGRRTAALYWLTAVAGCWVLAELLARLMMLWLSPAEYATGLVEVPYRAFALSAVVVGFFAVMMAKDLHAYRRKWPYLLTSVVLALIGFAHFYLGRASLLSLFAAAALGLGWLALVGIGYRRRARPRAHPVPMMLGFYGALVILTALQVQASSDQLLEQSRLSLPERELVRSEWRAGGWEVLPQRRSRFGAAGSQRFDLQLAADLDAVTERLRASGWEKTDAASAWALLRRPEADRADTPHLPRDFAGRPEDLMLYRVTDEDARSLLRLWSSGARLDTGQPLWLGQVRDVSLEAGMLGLLRWRDQPAGQTDALAALLEALPEAMAAQAQDGPILLSLESD